MHLARHYTDRFGTQLGECPIGRSSTPRIGWQSFREEDGELSYAAGPATLSGVLLSHRRGALQHSRTGSSVAIDVERPCDVPRMVALSLMNVQYKFRNT